MQQQNAVSKLIARREFVESRRATQVIQFPAPPPEDISEEAFQYLIVDLLEACGWWVHHEVDSRKSDHGFPDLWAVRPPRLLAIELKTKKGAPDLPQLWWMQDLARSANADTFQYHLWRPGVADWAAILMAVAPVNTVFDPVNTVQYLSRQGPEPERKPPGRRRK